jgi:Fe-S oxidoreductase
LRIIGKAAFDPPQHNAFGWIDKWARLASVAPGFANLFTQLPVFREIAKFAVGVPRERQIPAFAPQTFKSRFRKRPRSHRAAKVLLWADTFNNYFMPETAEAAVNVLEHAGYEVVVPAEHLCCGRPLYDYGFLDMATSYLHRILNALTPYIKADIPMVVLEPSCCSVFRDEMHALLPDSAAAARLGENTFTLSEFLEKKVPGYQPPQINRRAIVQGHCHHKAIMRFKEEKSLMEKMVLKYEVLESGCCGMAGSFGYEKDKYEVSVACGERALLPRLRQEALSTIIVADGFSCKEQIAQESERHALHLAEVMQMALHSGPGGPPDGCPEQQTVESRSKGQRQSMVRAGVIAAGVLAAGILGLAWFRRRA